MNEMCTCNYIFLFACLLLFIQLQLFFQLVFFPLFIFSRAKRSRQECLLAR